MDIRAPATSDEWNAYYQLRWEILRAPWQQPVGSEKDELEDQAIHRAGFINNQLVAVGRMHPLDSTRAQIRYMAVAQDYRQQGFGQRILKSLEEAARDRKLTTIELNAREQAIDFYQRNGYRVIADAATLFDSIKHKKMQRQL